MKLAPEIRAFLNEVAEQLRVDAEIIEAYIKLIRKDQPDQVPIFEAFKDACEGKWRRALEYLD
ncbi:MAG: hypothetical protein FWH27_14445 [Planctomycetaceae bacterium]|nr:hypothetical protein [Planctomycetaceae bacterium]